MATFQSLNCVKSQVPPSISFQSLSLRPAVYDPGLASLTVRIAPSTGPRRPGSGSVRVVHGAPELHTAVEKAVGTGGQTGGGEKRGAGKKEAEVVKVESPEDEAEDGEAGFWSCPLEDAQISGESLHALVVSLFSCVCDASWDIVSACSFTEHSQSLQTYEVLSWVLKRQSVATAGAESCAILLSPAKPCWSVSVLPASSTSCVEVNNVVRNCIESHPVEQKKTTEVPTSDDSAQTASAPKTSESGYISEEEKRTEDERLDETNATNGDKKQETDSEEKKAIDNKVDTPARGEDAAKTNPEHNLHGDTAQDTGCPTMESPRRQSLTGECHQAKQSSDNSVDQKGECGTTEVGDKIDTTLEAISAGHDTANSEDGCMEKAETSGATPVRQQIQKAKSIACPADFKDSSITETPDDTSSGDAGGGGADPAPVLRSPGRSQVAKTKSLLANMLGGANQLVPAKYKEAHDDPNCPSEFKCADGHLSNILIEIVYQMFSRKWKLSAATKLQGTQDCLLLFRHDSRILPGIGQQRIAGLVIHYPPPTGLAGDQSSPNKPQGSTAAAASGGEVSKDDGVSTNDRQARPEIEIVNTDTAAVERITGELGLEKLAGKSGGRYQHVNNKGEETTLLSGLIFSFSKQSFSPYSNIQVGDLSLFMFRQSNIRSGRGLTLTLHRGNYVTLEGGGQEEVAIIREVLTTRWPYPIAVDRSLQPAEDMCQLPAQDSPPKEKEEKTQEKGEEEKKPLLPPTDLQTGEKKGAGRRESDESSAGSGQLSGGGPSWEWKVRRYPWRVSYGARLIDRAVRAAGRIFHLPHPAHQDLESAKSVVVFSIKELSEKGWKYCGGVHSNNSTYLYFLK